MAEMRAGIYCRVASEDDLAMDLQEQALREYAVRNHYRNLRFYRDNGYSGLRFDGRSGFEKLCEDIRAGEIGTVIVKDLARIGRGYALVKPWLDELAQQGVNLVVMDQPDIPFPATKCSLP